MSQAKGTVSFRVAIPAADEIELSWESDSPHRVSLRGIGGPDLLRALVDWRSRYGGVEVSKWPLPEGDSRVDFMLRRLILWALGQWEPPFQEEELCHCRAVPTATVVDAMLLGARTPEEVSTWTSASTSCGSCRKDVIAMFKYFSGR